MIKPFLNCIRDVYTQYLEFLLEDDSFGMTRNILYLIRNQTTPLKASLKMANLFILPSIL